MARRLTSLFIIVVTLMLAASARILAGPTITPEPWHSRVDSWVLHRAQEGPTECLLFLHEQPDLSAAANLPSKLEKGLYVYEKLSTTAVRTQGPVLKALQDAGVEYRPYWVANMIWVRADLATLQAMALHPDVARIHANPTVRLPEPMRAGSSKAPGDLQAIEWNISQVKAPEVWAHGFTGQGAVVAGQDTGYQWDHPALKNQYRGWNGVSASHDYNWHDAIHSGSGPCGADAPAPCDDHNHGTHTMGTMVGNDGGANQIGLAPGARWIGCRNMNQGNGSPATYSECFQWFIAPTRIDNSDADPSMAPDVINNSWSCTAGEGCTDPTVLLTVVNNVRAAGIATVNSAGNSGPACGSINTPAAIYNASFTVGATDSTDAIAGFSSRGPVTVDGSKRRKPDISAPGVNIRSSVRGGGYQSGWSGTSMAAPHVAGLMALLIAANPFLTGQVGTLEQNIEQTASPRTTTQICGDTSTAVPNNVYGWGRIDALAAYQAVSLTGVLRVVLAPQGAIDAGAQWRVDGGAWKNSGARVSGLLVGKHTVAFKTVAGWTGPGRRQVTIKADQTSKVTGTYVQQLGSLSVTISPQAAITAGARWRVDGGLWQKSGATVEGLPVGDHVLGFRTITGWIKPPNRTIPVKQGQTTVRTGTYTH